jgi:hypothetical protein
MTIPVQAVDKPLKNGSATRWRLCAGSWRLPVLGWLGLELGGADLAEQAAQEPDELHWLAVVAVVALGQALGVF